VPGIVLEPALRPAVERIVSDDVLAAFHQREERAGNGRHAARGHECRFGAFHGGEPRCNVL